MQHITLFDYILLPFYLLFFFALAKRMARKQQEPELRKYLMTAFWLRMFGSIAYSMIVQYYYGYGDSFTYYVGSNFFTEQFSKDITTVRYLFAPFSEMKDWYNSTGGDAYYSGYFENSAGNMVMRISAILSYLSFNKFLLISLFFGFFSFAGQWKLFQVMDDVNLQRKRKLLAFAVLYSPSIWFWGSGLLKDSLCLGGAGFIIYILYGFFVKKKFSFRDLFLLAFLVFLITIIKSYITSILFLGIAIMGFSIFLKSVKNVIARIFLLGVAVIMMAGVLYISDITSQITAIAEDSISQIKGFQQNYQLINEEENSSAAFGLGEMNPSIGSLIMKAPLVIFTCIFRPFLWESRKIIILFTSLESTLVLLSTLYIMFKMGIISFLRAIFNTPHLLFCFCISMMFALIIGFTTFNFGTMIRYKIIFLPFYYFLLVNLYSNYLATPKTVQTQPLI